MSSQSNVGDSNAYGNDDQRNRTQNEVDEAKKDARFHEGKSGAHDALDSKDERSIANKLERESKRENEKDEETPETKALKKDPTLPAKMKGNEPSKGAKIDKEIQEEEEEMLKKKGAFGPKAAN